MKTIGTTTWNAPNAKATNNRGWSEIPGGFCIGIDFFGDNKEIRYWCCAFMKENKDADFGPYLQSGENSLGSDRSKLMYGMSVRCSKDK